VIVPIMTYERSTLVNSEKYIGLDVHQATISVAVMDSKGKVVMESILETKASTILEFFAGLRGTLSVTFEEGTWAAWLYDLLKPHVAKLVVCNPRKNALLKHGNKSDKIDARLAHHPMDGFVDRLHTLRFLRACDPGYRGLTLTLVGLPPTEHLSLFLDMRLGDPAPLHWGVRSSNHDRKCDRRDAWVGLSS
jgi:transposase